MGNYIEELLVIIRPMQNEFQESTQDLIRHIEEEHLEYIERQAKNIRADLAELSK
jgi:hypothetical protein